MFAEAGARMTLLPLIFEAPGGAGRANGVWSRCPFEGRSRVVANWWDEVKRFAT
jgi:hypothetical protein